jgi:hypothetical protein
MASSTLAYFGKGWRATALAVCAGCAAGTARSGGQGSGASTLAADAAETVEAPERALDDGGAPDLAAPSAASSLSSLEFRTEWAWIKTQFPEAEGFLPAERPGLLSALLRWAKVGRPTKVFDLACRAFTVRRMGDELGGRIFPQVEIHGSRKTVTAPEVTFGNTVVVTCGSTEEYDQQSDGTWKLISSQGYGCAKNASFQLSRVSADAAWYSGAEVHLYLQCVEKVEERAPCNDGGARTCIRCGRWAIQASSSLPMLGIRVGQRPARSIVLDTPADCRQPCSVDDDLARRAARVIHDHAFFIEGLSEHPFLFRTRAACAEYRRRNVVPKSELEPWW